MTSRFVESRSRSEVMLERATLYPFAYNTHTHTHTLGYISVNFREKSWCLGTCGTFFLYFHYKFATCLTYISKYFVYVCKLYWQFHGLSCLGLSCTDSRSLAREKPVRLWSEYTVDYHLLFTGAMVITLILQPLLNK